MLIEVEKENITSSRHATVTAKDKEGEYYGFNLSCLS